MFSTLPASLTLTLLLPTFIPWIKLTYALKLYISSSYPLLSFMVDIDRS